MFKIAVIAVKHPTEPNLYLHGLRRDNGKWALAGGHFNGGETDLEAASRELEEETGLKGVKLNKLANERFGDNDVHLFHCDCPQDFTPNSGDDPDSEFLTFKWLDPTAHNNMHVPARNNILIRHLNETLGKSEIQITVSDEELGTLEKTAPRFVGDIHPNQPWIAMKHPSGNVMWHANKDQASKLDRTISNPELIQNFLNKIPESHKSAASAVIKMVQKDPNRHFIPTEEGGTQKLRARHIKSLIYGNTDVRLDTSTPNVLKITRSSHSQQQRYPDITVSYKFGGQSGGVAKNERSGTSGLSSDVQLGARAESSLHADGNGIYLEQSEGFITGQNRPRRNSRLTKSEINAIFRNGLKKSDGQNLIHYSTQKGLKEIHPEKMGTGVRGLQYKRGLPENKSSFFYTEDSEPEQMVAENAQSKYMVKMPQNVYDFSTDPENFQQKVLDSNQGAWNEDKLHGLLKQHGYAGVKWSINPKTHVVQLYHPQTVHEEHVLKSENLNKAPVEYKVNPEGSVSRPLSGLSPAYKIISEKTLPNGLKYKQFKSEETENHVHRLYHPETNEALSEVMTQESFDETPHHKVIWSQVSPHHKNKGLGKQAYLAALVHGKGMKGLTSDNQLSQNAHKMWTSMRLVPGIGGRIAKYVTQAQAQKNPEAAEVAYDEPHHIFIRDTSKLNHNLMFPKIDLSMPLAASEDFEYEGLAKNLYPVKLNPEHGKKIAEAYHNMKHDPSHPAVKASYDALINETKKQYQDLLNQGFKFTKVTDSSKYPYKNSKDMHYDIENNKHLYYFPTESGFGSENDTPKDHPLLASTEFKSHDNKPMAANDLLRQVHDINGHFHAGKTSFGPIGEQQSYLHHKKMYSEAAQPALANELIMQNSWVNFGPHGEHNRANPKETIFAPQKTGLVPDWVWKGSWHGQT